MGFLQDLQKKHKQNVKAHFDKAKARTAKNIAKIKADSEKRRAERNAKEGTKIKVNPKYILKKNG